MNPTISTGAGQKLLRNMSCPKHMWLSPSTHPATRSDRCVVERNGLEWLIPLVLSTATSRVYRGVSRGWSYLIPISWQGRAHMSPTSWSMAPTLLPRAILPSSSSPPPLQSYHHRTGAGAALQLSTTTYFPLPNYLLSTESNSHFNFYHGDENYFHPKRFKKTHVLPDGPCSWHLFPCALATKWDA